MGNYKTTFGQCICGDAKSLINELQDNSVDLFITSPPYPLINPKEYGNESQDNYNNWLLEFVRLMIPKLKPTGSIVIDFGTSYLKNKPCYNIYSFELLVRMVKEFNLNLCQPFYWYNPSRLPYPSMYVCRRKIRAKDNVNNLWWLSPNASPKADTTKVLKPYSKSMKKFFRKKSPTDTSFQKNKGALPSNLLEIANANNKSQYLQACRSLDIKYHPARFPTALPEFFVKFLTDENDLVVDIFGGSNTTGYVCESLKRRWKTFEINLEYVATSAFHFISDINNAKLCYDTIINSDITVDISIF
ncbi:MAG: site-specific DNA-methyltransferase [Ruminococcus sp.]|nr:site-specific DNA-methyltransferase [Ruminococcus sp.]